MSPNQYFLQEDLTLEQLAAFRQQGAVGVDTEMTGLLPFRDRLCLVQISGSNGTTVLVKTQQWEKAHNLKALLQDEQVIKVFHFAIMDCAFLLRYLQVQVANAYCTKIASRLARTYSPSHSLSTLLEELYEIKLDKTQRSTDWCRAELSPAQIQYAASDSIWLVDLRTKLEEILAARGQLETGITFAELNQRCQQFIPTLVHLWVNGWDFGREDGKSVFAH
jgi:ribonuclease D